MTTTQNTKQENHDSYVECDSCGHPIEDHDRTGCAESGCTVGWLRTEIIRVRQQSGLPGRF